MWPQALGFVLKNRAMRLTCTQHLKDKSAGHDIDKPCETHAFRIAQICQAAHHRIALESWALSSESDTTYDNSESVAQHLHTQMVQLIYKFYQKQTKTRCIIVSSLEK